MSDLIKNKYKQTAVGLIPIEWDVLKLVDVVTLINGKAYTQEELLDKGKYRVLRVGNLYSNNNWYYSDLELDDDKYVVKGDLMYSWSASFGPQFWQEEKTIYHYHIWKVLVTNKTTKDFIYQLLEFDKELILRKTQGGTMVHITKGDMENRKLPIPSLPEQQKIASILSTWDLSIDHCKSIIEKLKERNKGLAQQLLAGNFKQKKLSEIFERVTTKNTEGNQNVITISAQRGFVRQTDFFNKVIASDILDNYFLVQKGDFCYNKSYSNGYDWGATKRLNDLDKAVVTTLYICFRLKDKHKNSGDFFEYYFENGILNEGLSKVANEGGRAHGLLNVTPTDFFNIKVGIPSFEEQVKIAKLLATASAELNQYQQKLQALQLQKKGLMQQLLTGKTRVKIDNN